MSVASLCCKSFCVVPCASFCTGHFVMVPLNMTYLHYLQHSLFEHLFNLYYKKVNNSKMEIFDSHDSFNNKHGIKVEEDFKNLASIHWLPKVHKKAS